MPKPQQTTWFDAGHEYTLIHRTAAFLAPLEGFVALEAAHARRAVEDRLARGYATSLLDLSESIVGSFFTALHPAERVAQLLSAVGDARWGALLLFRKEQTPPAPAAQSPEPLIHAMTACGIVENQQVLLNAFGQVGAAPEVGFTLAACCAVVWNESRGRNVWGHDPWNQRRHPLGEALPANLKGQVVTEADYLAYAARRDAGMQAQGCGPCQLTSPNLQIEGDQACGCWLPLPNMIVGFRFLKTLFVRQGSARLGFQHYNGSGPAAVAYANTALARMRTFERAGVR